MKCEDYLLMIEEYFDGELDQGQVRAITQHLAACPSCAGEYELLRREQELYSTYQREAEVTPALWASVQAKIREEKPARASLVDRLRERIVASFSAPRLSLVAAVALVLIAVGATIAVMSYLNSRNVTGTQPVAGSKPNNTAPNTNEQDGTTAQGGNNDSENVAPVDVEPQRVSTGGRAPARNEIAGAKPTPEQLIREAEQKYIAAIAMLSKEVNRRRLEIDPAVLARFEGALAAIDRTIDETRRAVRHSPNDPVAVQYMLSAYAKKIDVLREMANS